MKKIISLIVCAYIITSMSSCGKGNKVEDVVTDIAESITDIVGNVTGKNEESDTKKETSNKESNDSAESLLVAIWNSVEEENRFAIGGGDSENPVMDAPGMFDITKEEELDVTLAFPMSQIGNIDDAASVVHMMNANTFTGAAYHLKNGTSADTFAADFKETLKNRRWMCGFPDCFTVMESNGYVITAFGARDQVEMFKKSAEKAVKDVRVIITEDIA